MFGVGVETDAFHIAGTKFSLLNWGLSQRTYFLYLLSVSDLTQDDIRTGHRNNISQTEHNKPNTPS